MSVFPRILHPAKPIITQRNKSCKQHLINVRIPAHSYSQGEKNPKLSEVNISQAFHCQEGWKWQGRNKMLKISSLQTSLLERNAFLKKKQVLVAIYFFFFGSHINQTCTLETALFYSTRDIPFVALVDFSNAITKGYTVHLSLSSQREGDTHWERLHYSGLRVWGFIFFECGNFSVFTDYIYTLCGVVR